MDRLERELGVLSEMALGAASLRDFEAQWLEHLRPSLGFETACSVWSGDDGRVLQATSLGYDQQLLERRFPAYMGELSAREVAGFCGPEPAIDIDIVSRARRERLTVYRELLAPLHVSSFVTNVWRSRWGTFGFHFARARHGATFGSRDTAWVARVTPCIKLGQALHAAQRLPVDDDWWASAWGLSLRELDAARLLARGLRNPEIAQLLRVSPHTVRNQLASVFRKADVSTRAELVFAMSASPHHAWRARDGSRTGAWRAFVTSRGAAAP
jgi:DNA-binding CsgD family transcriptional regulator